MHRLEKGVEPVVETIESAATIIDGMAMIQKVKASGITYATCEAALGDGFGYR